MTNFQNKIVRVCSLLLMVVALGAAADEITPAIVVHPGEPVHVLVTFKEGGVSVEGGYARFNIQTAVRDGQQSFSRQLTADNFKKLSDRQVEITATVGDKTASGDYRIDMIVGYSNGVSRTYTSGNDFEVTPAVRIENPHRIDFPNIKDVKVSK